MEGTGGIASGGNGGKGAQSAVSAVAGSSYGGGGWRRVQCHY
jgi:hypothetical protein